MNIRPDIRQLAKERILVIDGAMGSLIQQYKLTEKDVISQQSCEKFLAHNLLAWDKKKDESEWSKVESKLHQEATSRKIKAGLKADGRMK